MRHAGPDSLVPCDVCGRTLDTILLDAGHSSHDYCREAETRRALGSTPLLQRDWVRLRPAPQPGRKRVAAG